MEAYGEVVFSLLVAGCAGEGLVGLLKICTWGKGELGGFSAFGGVL